MTREKLTIEVICLALTGINLGVGVWQLFKGEIATALACCAIAKIYLLKLDIMEGKE